MSVQELELVVIKKVKPSIKANFEQMKEYLNNELKKYELIIVTDENLDDSKQVQKYLAKTKKTIDDYRKEIKMELLQPITEFENMCKELIELVDKTNQPIKDGIEVFNDIKRQEKLNYANEIITAHCINFNLEASDFKILDTFTNLNASKKSISDELDNQMSELVALKEQKENNIILLQQHLEQLNTTFCLDVPMTYEEISSKINNNNFMELSQFLLSEVARRKQIQDKIKEQIMNTEQLEKDKTKEQQANIVEKETQVVDTETGEIIDTLTITLELTGTNEQLKELRKFIDANNIIYKKI